MFDNGEPEEWQLVEERAYTDSLRRCGKIEIIERSLFLVDHGLRRNPHSYPLVPGLTSIYMAKTKLRLLEGQIVPALRMWFRPSDAEHMVYKLYVEPCPPQEMKFGESFWDDSDDDGLPFG